MRHDRFQQVYLCDGDKLTWDRVKGAIAGTQDPLKFPVTYPPIDFDPDTKKMFYIGCGIIAGSLVLGAIIRAKIS